MTATTLPLPDVTPDLASRCFYATSASHPGLTHTIGIAESPAGQLVTLCTCPAGIYTRPDRRPIACRHGRAVAVLLESYGSVESSDLGWRFTTADPFADIAHARRRIIELEPLEGHHLGAAVDPYAEGYDAGFAAALRLVTDARDHGRLGVVLAS